MPGIPQMAATVVIVTAFFKVALAKINIVAEGAWAVVLAVLACVGVWGYHLINTGSALDFGTIQLLIELIISAVIGYKFLPDSVKDFSLKNLRGAVLNNK